MTTTEDDLMRLSQIATEKRMKVSALGMANVAGLSFEELVKLNQECDLARAELFAAENELRAAMYPEGKHAL